MSATYAQNKPEAAGTTLNMSLGPGALQGEYEPL
jgi:hypothetical protein